MKVHAANELHVTGMERVFSEHWPFALFQACSFVQEVTTMTHRVPSSIWVGLVTCVTCILVLQALFQSVTTVALELATNGKIINNFMAMSKEVESMHQSRGRSVV